MVSFSISLSLSVGSRGVGEWGLEGLKFASLRFGGRIDYKRVTMSLNSSAGFFNDLGDLHEDHRHDDR